jgi:hypothetical protein
MMYQEDDEDVSSEELSIDEDDDDVFPPTLGEIKDSYPSRSKLVTAVEYERRIQRLEQINATLRENISALYAEANAMTERQEPTKSRRARLMEISQDEAYETSIVPYEDPSVTENQCMHQIEKLEKTNASLRWKLARQKLLVSQLSANLKVASDKIEELQSEAISSTALVTYDPDSADNSSTAINPDKMQVVQNELQSIAQLICQNTTAHKAETAKLLEVDMAVHRAQVNEETVSDKIQRVIRQLRGEQSSQSIEDIDEDEQATFDSEQEQHTQMPSPVQSPKSLEDSNVNVADIPETHSVSDESDVSSIDSWHKDPDKVGRKSIIDATLQFVQAGTNQHAYIGDVEADRVEDLEERHEDISAAGEEADADITTSHSNTRDQEIADKNDGVSSDDEPSSTCQRPSIIESIQSDYSTSDNQLHHTNELLSSNEYLASDANDASFCDSSRNDQVIESPAAIVASTLRELEGDINNLSAHLQNRKSSWGISVGDEIESIKSESVASEESSSVESWHRQSPKQSEREVKSPPQQDQVESIYFMNVDTIDLRCSVKPSVMEADEEDDVIVSDNLDGSAHEKIKSGIVKEDSECISSEELSTTNAANGESEIPTVGEQNSPDRENPTVFDYSISDLIPSKSSPPEVTDDTLLKESTDTIELESGLEAKHNNSRNDIHESSMSLSVHSLKVWDEYAIRNRKIILSACKSKTPQSKEDPSDPLSARLSRRQLFKQRPGVSPLENIERKQHHVLVRTVNGDFVPPISPPPQPPNNQNAPLFKKGSPDGYYKYKSSSGNEYKGYWQHGKRHGFGTAKVCVQLHSYIALLCKILILLTLNMTSNPIVP